MRFDTAGKLNRPRVQASLVALLYVFLCTFGTLTHTHAGSEGAHTACEAEASATASRAPHPRSRHICGSSVAPVQVCAFCDWQANSVSPALASLRLLPPQPFPFASFAPLVLAEATHTARGTSRAPPFA